MKRYLPIMGLAGILVFIACTPRDNYKTRIDLADTLNPACDYPEAHQFDFWVGEWELAWGDSGTGTNSIQRILNQCIIQENFNGEGFRGLSVSSYDPFTEQWKQTWVDNNGTYLDFKGGLVEDKMILSRQVHGKDRVMIQRMVWYNIGEDTLDWNWEVSQDSGKTWTVNWKIDYTRKM